LAKIRSKNSDDFGCFWTPYCKQHGWDYQRIEVLLHQIGGIPQQFVDRKQVLIFLKFNDPQQHLVFVEGESNGHVRRQVGICQFPLGGFLADELLVTAMTGFHPSVNTIVSDR